MKLLLTTVVLFIIVLQCLCASIDSSSSNVSNLDINKKGSDICGGLNVKIHLSNVNNRIDNNFITFPEVKCLSIENSGIVEIEEGVFNDFSDLIYLSLQGNAISTDQLFSFGNPLNLQELVLNNQKTENRSEQVLRVRDTYPKLERLHLSNANIFSIVEDYKVPFPSLKYLSLSNNIFNNATPFNVNNLATQLEELHLDGNTLSQISFEYLTQLSLLTLDNNNIKIIGSKDGLNLNSLNSLSELSLQNNQIAFIDTEAFSTTANLKILNLNGNSLSYIIPNTFKQMDSLESLILDHNSFNDIPLFSLSPLNIVSLSMDFNNIRYVSDDVLINLPKLETLSIKDNSIFIFDENTFDQQASLKHLFLNRNKLSFLPTNWCVKANALETINLEGNEFCSLAKMNIDSCSSVQILRVMGNPLQDFNADSFKAIPENTTIAISDVNSKTCTYIQ